MQVSVVCCTYDETMYNAFREAANSVLRQTYSDIELVVVVDGTTAVFEKAKGEFGDRDSVQLHCNEENLGLSASRNVGWKLATGDIVAFIDDDAVADEQWVETLVSAYEQRDAASVGGRMVADWVAGKPYYLPEEFYWIIGVTHRGFADGPTEVRNTNGSNISFRREVLAELGGFDESLGRQGEAQIQAEETELCVRMYDEFGERTWYEPDAKVAHKVFDHRIQPRFLFERAFWQGYSKRKMKQPSTSASAEQDFLGQLLTAFIPQRIVRLVRSPSIERAAQLLMVVLLTATVGAGYLYGAVR